MAKCECCWKNEGTARERETVAVGSWQPGGSHKVVPSKILCDACNDGQFPYFGQEGIGPRVCPHNV